MLPHNLDRYTVILIDYNHRSPAFIWVLHRHSWLTTWEKQASKNVRRKKTCWMERKRGKVWKRREKWHYCSREENGMIECHFDKALSFRKKVYMLFVGVGPFKRNKYLFAMLYGLYMVPKQKIYAGRAAKWVAWKPLSSTGKHRMLHLKVTSCCTRVELYGAHPSGHRQWTPVAVLHTILLLNLVWAQRNDVNCSKRGRPNQSRPSSPSLTR